ncbi:MAG: thiamine-binding protein [Nocardioidaceae bacterium]
MRLVAEFTTEPFEGEGEPPPHATEALEVALRSGLECDFGPLGTSVRGESADLFGAIGEILSTAFGQGATRVTLQVERDDRG